MSTGGSSLGPILVVDDVDEIVDLIERLLRADGYSVDVARSEEQAIACAQRSPPQLILLNLSSASPPAGD